MAARRAPLALLPLLLLLLPAAPGARARRDGPGEAAFFGVAAPAAGAPRGEAAVAKFVETLLASERYLHTIEAVERKLDHLDATFHERSDGILRAISEAARARVSPAARADGGGAAGAGGACSALERRLARVEGAAAGAARGAQAVLGAVERLQARPRARAHTAGAEAAALLAELDGVQRARVDRLPSDCGEIQQQGFNVSGIYKICPDADADADGGGAEPFYVLCELGDGGGWTVFQNRFDGSQDFYRGWDEYKRGFGNLAGEFWLGLDKLRRLTAQRLYELRVELEARAHDAHGHARSRAAHATYSVFALGAERDGYRISALGAYRGTAGDSLSYHAGQPFSTRDADRDAWPDGACAEERGGAWWYKECDKSNLNGRYSPPAARRAQAAYWVSLAEPGAAPLPLTGTRMMLRPLPPAAPHAVPHAAPHAASPHTSSPTA